MLKTQYVSLEEYFDYTGENLEAELKSDDNPSKTAEAFLKRIEVRLEAFISAKFHRNIDYEYTTFSEYQKKHFKYAIIEQAIYELRNSEISTDSGYDIDKGVIISRANIEELRIAPNTKDQLQLCGLWNRNIQGIRGGYGGWRI